ncbi:MAG: adenylyl-sulfate kinase [Anaerolineae bacterium]|nr:adenylyl-sulfate kinase [Anaerolineae bacterium]
MERPTMSIVIVGHVDHGKSTILGRLLADTDALPQGKLEQIQAFCERNSRPFEYAFLLDALKDERAQNITIDAARVFFRSAARRYLVIDAPGHVEFVRNMVTGASHAETALLVIDALEGVQENSRRHGYLLSMLGVRRVIVLINKMDLVEYRQERFDEVRLEYAAFLDTIHIQPLGYIPVSGREGDNIASRSPRMPWYEGPTVLESLDALESEPPPIDKPFRMPVQDVYRFTAFGDARRIVAGSVVSGKLAVGDPVVFYPSAKRSVVRSFESIGTPPAQITSGTAAGLTLDEQIYIHRGEIIAREGEVSPHVSDRLLVSLFWLGRQPLAVGKELWLKLGTARVKARVEEIRRVIDAGQPAQDGNGTGGATQVQRNEVTECTLSLGKALAFDRAAELQETGRFVLVDRFEICGGGIILDDAGDTQRAVRDSVMLRNLKWEKSTIPGDRRSEMYNQRATLVLVTGSRGVGRKDVAKRLETLLFEAGKKVYYLAIGSVLRGLDADLTGADPQSVRQEHIRRMAEVAHILLDAGLILIVTAIGLTPDDLEVFKAIVNPDTIVVVWVGNSETTGIAFDLQLPGHGSVDESSLAIKQLLQERGAILGF